MIEETRGRKPTLFSQAAFQAKQRQVRKRRKAREKDPSLARIDLTDRDPEASPIYRVKRKHIQTIVELRKKVRQAVVRSKKRLEREKREYPAAYKAYRQAYVNQKVREHRARKRLAEQEALRQELLELQS